MATPELISYVRSQLAAGVPRDAIRRALVSGGWVAQDIEEAFAITAPIVPAVIQPVAARHSYFATKLSLSIGLIVISVAYVLSQYFGGQKLTAAVVPPISVTPTPVETPVVQVVPAPVAATTPVATSPQPVATVVPTPVVPPPVPTPQPVKPAGLYADGTYTGSTANAYYGLVQVQAIVQNGQLADVKFLQYPSDRSTSRYINSQAMPMLTSEAIQAQSANVDIVSGATFTSQAFQQSLASALASAKN